MSDLAVIIAAVADAGVKLGLWIGLGVGVVCVAVAVLGERYEWRSPFVRRRSGEG